MTERKPPYYHGPWKLESGLNTMHHLVLASRKDKHAVDKLKQAYRDHPEEIHGLTSTEWTPLMIAACHSREPGPRSCLAYLLTLPETTPEEATEALWCWIHYHDTTAGPLGLSLLAPHADMNGGLVDYAIMRACACSLIQELVYHGARFRVPWDSIIYNLYFRHDMATLTYLITKYPDRDWIYQLNPWFDTGRLTVDMAIPIMTRSELEQRCTILDLFQKHGLTLEGRSFNTNGRFGSVSPRDIFQWFRYLTNRGMVPDEKTVVDSIRHGRILLHHEWLDLLHYWITTHRLKVQLPLLAELLEHKAYAYVDVLLQRFDRLRAPDMYYDIITLAISHRQYAWVKKCIDQFPNYVHHHEDQRFVNHLLLGYHYNNISDDVDLMSFLEFLVTDYGWQPTLQFTELLIAYVGNYVRLGSVMAEFMAKYLMTHFEDYDLLAMYLKRLTHVEDFPFHALPMSVYLMHGARMMIDFVHSGYRKHWVLFQDYVSPLFIYHRKPDVIVPCDAPPRDYTVIEYMEEYLTGHECPLIENYLTHYGMVRYGPRYWQEQGIKKMHYQWVLSPLGTTSFMEAWQYAPGHWRSVAAQLRYQRHQGSDRQEVYRLFCTTYPRYVEMFDLTTLDQFETWLDTSA